MYSGDEYYDDDVTSGFLPEDRMEVKGMKDRKPGVTLEEWCELDGTTTDEMAAAQEEHEMEDRFGGAS